MIENDTRIKQRAKNYFNIYLREITTSRADEEREKDKKIKELILENEKLKKNIRQNERKYNK